CIWRHIILDRHCRYTVVGIPCTVCCCEYQGVWTDIAAVETALTDTQTRTTAVVTTSSIYLICGDTCCTTCIQGNGDVLTYSDGRGIVYDRYLLRTGRGITCSIYRGIGHCSCTKSKSCW